MTLKCVECGRFLSYAEIEDGRAHHYFEPDSDKGPEISEWICARCVDEPLNEYVRTNAQFGVGA